MLANVRTYTTWSWLYPELTGCVKCKSNIYKHRSTGICTKCYWRLKAKKERLKRLTNPEFGAHFRERAKLNARKRREKEENRHKENKANMRWYYKNQAYRSEYYKKYYNLRRDYHLLRAIKRTLGLERERVVALYKRDRNKCRWCGRGRKEMRLDIHHIDGQGLLVKPEERNNKLDNLMLACQSCHTKLDHLRRKELSQYNTLIKELLT